MNGPDSGAAALAGSSTEARPLNVSDALGYLDAVLDLVPEFVWVDLGGRPQKKSQGDAA